MQQNFFWSLLLYEKKLWKTVGLLKVNLSLTITCCEKQDLCFCEMIKVSYNQRALKSLKFRNNKWVINSQAMDYRKLEVG